MNSLRTTIALITVIALLMLFVYSTQSMPTNDDSTALSTRQKRWTFNTWRLHGRRQLSNDFYSPTTFLSSSSNGDQQYDEDDLARTVHERLSQLFPEFGRV